MAAGYFLTMRFLDPYCNRVTRLWSHDFELYPRPNTELIVARGIVFTLTG